MAKSGKDYLSRDTSRVRVYSDQGEEIAAGNGRFRGLPFVDEFSSWTFDARDAASKLPVCYSEGGAAHRRRN